MRRFALILAIAGLALAALLAGAAWKARRVEAPPPASAIGGPFHLIDQNGAAVDERILNGKWTAVFFGYTYCPDVCPTTLATLAQAIERLGPGAKTFQVVFISVDPGRDTPAQLKAYLSSPAFPKGVIGLTGSPAQVAAAARAYRVYYRKAGDGPGYSVDHTSIVYLMDPKGRFSRPIAFGLPPDRSPARSPRRCAAPKARRSRMRAGLVRGQRPMLLRCTMARAMLYAIHEAAYRSAAPLRLAARAARDFWRSPINPAAASGLGRTLYASADLMANLTRRYFKPAWGIDEVDGRRPPVRVHARRCGAPPWVKLRHFARDPADLKAGRRRRWSPGGADRRAAVRATTPPCCAARCRPSCRTTTSMSPTGPTPATCRCWRAGSTSTTTSTTSRDMLRQIGRRARTWSRSASRGRRCWPPPRLMAEDDDPARPASLTFMGSPIDARLSPTVTNKLAEERPFTWFQSNMIYTVPPPYPGAAAGLSGLRAALQLHVDERRRGTRRPTSATSTTWCAATATAPTSTASSMTSTCRCWT